eukprot:g2928.t1
MEEAMYKRIVEALHAHDNVVPSQAIGSQVSHNAVKESHQLERLLMNMSSVEVVDMLRERVNDAPSVQGKYSFQNVLQAVFIGLGSSPSCRRKRFSVFKLCIESMKNSVVSGRSAKECVKILLPETFELGDEQIPKLVRDIVSALESSSVRLVRQLVAQLDSRANACDRSNEMSLAPFALLPKLLSLVKDRKEYAVGGGISSDDGENNAAVERVTGSQFKSQILRRLFEVEWPPAQAAQLAAILMEIELTSEQIEAATTKILMLIGQSTQLQEIPALAYQLLLLATNQSKKVKRKILTEMLLQLDILETSILDDDDDDDNYYDDDGVRNVSTPGMTRAGRSRELRQVEGTVLLHLNFAAKQDQGVGKLALRLFEDDQWPASPFRVALMLSMATIHRMKGSVLSALKQWVLSAAIHGRESCEHAWLRNISKRERETTSWIGMARDVDVSRTLVKAALLATKFWDHILPAAVEMGFLLIDHRSPSGPFANASSMKDAALCHVCGIEMLSTCFQRQRACRATVLKGVLSRIMSSGSYAAADAAMRLLSSLVSEHGVAMHSMHDQFKETLEYLPLLPMKVARKFLSIIVPLLRSRASVVLRNYAPIVFRKAVFRRELTSRVVAIEGMMIMATGSVSANRASDERERWQQIGGLLRRALTQQVRVRMAAYAGLMRAFEECTFLRESVTSMLLDRLRYFVEVQQNDGNDDKDGAVVPVNMARLVARTNMSSISEPIGAFLGVAVRVCCAVLANDYDGGSDEVDLARQIDTVLRKLTRRIPQLELEDWSMDKSTDFSQGVPDGRRNKMRAEMLAKIIDALMVHLLCRDADSDIRTARMVGLLSFRCDVETIVRNQSGFISSSSKSKLDASRLTLPLARLDPEQKDILLAWWFNFFNTETATEMDGDETEAEDDPSSNATGVPSSITVARRDKTMHRWILNACVDRFNSKDGEESEDSKRNFALVLAPQLLVNFELLQNRPHEDSARRETSSRGSAAVSKKSTKGKKSVSTSSAAKLEKLADLSLTCLCNAADHALNNAEAVDIACTFMRKLFSATLQKRGNDAEEEEEDDDDCVGNNDTASRAALHRHASMTWLLVEHLIKKTFVKRAERLIVHALEPTLAFIKDPKLRCEHSKRALRIFGGMSRVIVGISGTLRCLLRIAVQCSDRSTNLTVLLHLGQECANAVDALDASSQSASQVSGSQCVRAQQIKSAYPIVTRDLNMRLAVMNSVLRDTNSELHAVERAISTLSPMLRQWTCAHEWFQNPSEHDSKSSFCGDVGTSLAIRQEMICVRMTHIVEVLEVMTKSVELGTSAVTRLFQTLVRCYKALGATIESAIAQKDCLAPRAVQHMRNLHCRVGSKRGGLTMTLYSFLSSVAQGRARDDDDDEIKRGQGRKKMSHAKVNAEIKRQSRQIPQLVYQIEQLEYSYLKLLKSSGKRVDFTMFMQRSTSRDFRIKPSDFVVSDEDEEEDDVSATEIMTDDDDEEEEEEEEETENEGEGDETGRKSDGPHDGTVNGKRRRALVDANPRLSQQMRLAE